MKAMVLEEIGSPLRLVDLPVPEPAAGQVLIRVLACGVCRTDLHVVDGDLPDPKLPIIPGHEIIGEVAKLGPQVEGFAAGDRVGVPWLGHTCGHCPYCLSHRENLCDEPGFTGYQVNGGYAEYTVADAEYCFQVPARYDPVEAAPLMCAGLIGYRSWKMTGQSGTLGIYGFGAAAHILAQVVRHSGQRFLAFTSPGDTAAQDFARQMGAAWAGGSDEMPPEPLDAAIIFAPVGALVPAALKALKKGGVLVCGGIHMSDIPAFPYRDLWEERVIRSVANLTRQDGLDFLPLAAEVPVRNTVHPYRLDAANDALDDLRNGRFVGAAVILP